MRRIGAVDLDVSAPGLLSLGCSREPPRSLQRSVLRQFARNPSYHSVDGPTLACGAAASRAISGGVGIDITAGPREEAPTSDRQVDLSPSPALRLSAARQAVRLCNEERRPIAASQVQ